MKSETFNRIERHNRKICPDNHDDDDTELFEDETLDFCSGGVTIKELVNFADELDMDVEIKFRKR